jgi:hypothetical protein
MEYESSAHNLHRQFMRNIAAEKCSLTLTKPELQSIPSRRIVKKYEAKFSNDKESKEIVFKNKNEFDMAKFSNFPDVRRKFFLSLSNINQANTQIILDVVNMRKNLATKVYGEADYFKKQ